MIVPNVSIRDYVFTLDDTCPVPTSTSQLGGRDFLSPYDAVTNYWISVSPSRIPPLGNADFVFRLAVRRRAWDIPSLVQQYRITFDKPTDSTYASYDSGWLSGWPTAKQLRLEIANVLFTTEEDSLGRPCYGEWDWESGSLKLYEDGALKLSTTTDPVHGMYYTPIDNFSQILAEVEKGSSSANTSPFGASCCLQENSPPTWVCTPNCGNHPGFHTTFHRTFQCELTATGNWYMVVGGTPVYPDIELFGFSLPDPNSDPDCDADCDCEEALPDVAIVGVNSNGIQVHSRYYIDVLKTIETTRDCEPLGGFPGIAWQHPGYRGTKDERWTRSLAKGVDNNFSFINSSRKAAEVFCNCGNVFDAYPAPPGTVPPPASLVIDGPDVVAYSAVSQHAEKLTINQLCFCRGGLGSNHVPCPVPMNDHHACEYRADQNMFWYPPVCDEEEPIGANPWNLVTSLQKFHRAEVQSGNVVYKTADGPTARDGWRSSEQVATTGDCSHPRMAEDDRGIIHLQYIRPDGLYGRHSTDRGKSFEPEELLLADVIKNTISPASQTTGLMIRVGLVPNSGSSGPGKLHSARRERGDTAWSAFAAIKNDAGVELEFEDDTFHIVPCNDEADRFQLTGVISGESTPSDWWTTDRGRTFTRVI